MQIGDKKEFLYTDLDKTALPITTYAAAINDNHNVIDVVKIARYIKRLFPDSICLTGFQFNKFIKTLNKYKQL